MPWAAGSYTKGNAGTGGWTGDASLGIGIEAGRHDTQDNDFATGINQCLNKDGSNAATGNLNAGGFKITAMAAGTADTDGITLGQAKAGIDQARTAGNYTLSAFSASTGGINQLFQKSRDATVGTNTIVQSGDSLGAIVWMGANGTGYNVAAAISGEVDGTPGVNDMPGRLVFATVPDGTSAGVERMRITNSGNVGIGNTSPTDLLTVGDGTTTFSASINGSTSGTGGGQGLNFGSIGRIGNYSRVVGGAYNAAFTFRSLGAVSLIADTGGFSMAGLTGSTGGSAMKWNSGNGVWFYDTSAARYKENIRDSTLGLATVKALRPRQYNYVYEGKPEDVGFIAEEVEPILPYLVSKNADGQCESITYDRLTSVLVKAVQELSEQVESLEARIEALEA